MTTTGERSRGRLIAIEGIDGTGKSTLARALGEALRARGAQVLVSNEPTRGEFGQQVRALAVGGREGVTPEREAELFTLDRQEHVRETVAPALAAGKTVILDRYYYSTMAYQGARGLDPEAIERDNRAFAPEPDLLVLLDLPVNEALVRITQKRGSVPDHFEGAEYLARVRDIFLQVEHPNRLLLDARKPIADLTGEILAGLGMPAGE